MYEQYYGLSARPFQLMPDPRLLFESRNHTRALSYLLYGLERREGFVIITGDVGTGKTLLLQTLLGELRTRHLSVARVAMANLDADSVLPSVAGAFGLPYKSRSKIEILDALVAKLLPGKRRGSLLIVDEAQACTPEALEELRAISNLQAHGQALVQVFLIGQTELRGLLSRPDMAHLRQRIVASHHLDPLDESEVSGYVEHRLSMVGWSGNPRFEDTVYERVFAWTRGIPRRINIIMDRLLLFGYLEDQQVISTADLDTVIGEFEEEFEQEALVRGEPERGYTTQTGAGAMPAAAGSRPQSAGVAALNDRIESLEKALRQVFGDARAGELMARYQASAEQREIVDAQMRVSRLEGLISELDQSGRSSRAPAPAADDESSAGKQPVPEPAAAQSARAPQPSPSSADTKPASARPAPSGPRPVEPRAVASPARREPDPDASQDEPEFTRRAASPHAGAASPAAAHVARHSGEPAPAPRQNHDPAPGPRREADPSNGALKRLFVWKREHDE